MKELDVLIFIEHKDRELGGTKDIIEKLIQFGQYSVVVTSIEFGFYNTFIKYNPKLVCMPYCRGLKNHVVNAFYQRNNHTSFINLNYEQIYNKLTIDYKKPNDEFAKKKLYHIAWGTQFMRYLINNGVENTHIYITGKPEVFFLKAMNQSKILIKEKLSREFSIRKDSRWVFLPLNDGTAFYSEDKLRYQIKKGKRLPESIISHQIQKKQISELITYICQACREINDVDFILRPHPGVSERSYFELFSRLGINISNHIHIIRDYTIKEWLCSSDLCISNWSTVLIDATSIGVNTMVFQPEELPDFMAAEWLDVFDKIRDYNTFLLFVKGEIKMKEELSKLICEYIDISKNPTEEIAGVISELIKQYHTTTNTKFKICYREIPHLIRSLVRNKIKNIPLIKNLISNRIKYDYFDELKYNI